jgi:hypothetical protein
MIPFRVLFLGNSYTHCNAMPDMIAKLAASADPPVAFEYEMVAPGGVTLEWHATNKESLDAIRKGGWDAVVLQEQSTRPVNDVGAMHHYGMQLAEAIRQKGTWTVLYMTWARAHRPEMLQGLRSAYGELAAKTGATAAPVGIAWARCRARHPEIALYMEDNSHPTRAGSYLAACVLYATLLDADPRDLDDAGAKSAAQLQEVAWSVVRGM